MGKTMNVERELAPIDRVRIRLVSRYSEPTIERWYVDPDSVRRTTDEHLRAVCAAVGVTPPPARRQ